MEILSGWLVGNATRSEPVRLYCFPHSGGSVADYIRWSTRMSCVEVWGVQLPGRGSRLSEAGITRMTDLVARIADDVHFGAPYALFGHCFGALTAYELTRELRRRDHPLPVRLFVSSYPAPHLPRPAPPIRDLPDEEFLAEVDRRYGNIPGEVHHDASLRAAVLSALRADFEALETYVHRPEPPLPCPLTVLSGRDDCIPDLGAWQRHSTAQVVVREFPGGHFYLHDQPDRVIRAVAAPLRPLIGGG